MGLMEFNLISRFSFDKQILYLLKIIFAKHLQTEAVERNLEPTWNYYNHTHLVEGIFMLLLLVNKVVLSQPIQVYTCLDECSPMKFCLIYRLA